MHAPDVGLHVAVAAGVVHRTCAVHSLCYVVYVLYEVCVYARVVGVPCLVERSPCDERRVVAVALHELCPFREEVARCQFVVHVESPACRFAPCKVSQLVSPVVITLLEALLVQARAVETGFFSKLDVLLESLVRWCCPYSVRIITLVEHETLEVRLVVQIEVSVSRVHLSHAGIRLHLVYRLAVLHHLVCDVVEERRLRAPQLHVLHRQHDDRVVGAVDCL